MTQTQVMKRLLILLLTSACSTQVDDQHAPAINGCERPSEVACADGTCSALYRCPSSTYVRTDDFAWCDLSRPDGYLCYWEDPT